MKNQHARDALEYILTRIYIESNYAIFGLI